MKNVSTPCYSSRTTTHNEIAVTASTRWFQDSCLSAQKTASLRQIPRRTVTTWNARLARLCTGSGPWHFHSSCQCQCPAALDGGSNFPAGARGYLHLSDQPGGISRSGAASRHLLRKQTPLRTPSSPQVLLRPHSETGAAPGSQSANGRNRRPALVALIDGIPEITPSYARIYSLPALLAPQLPRPSRIPDASESDTHASRPALAKVRNRACVRSHEEASLGDKARALPARPHAPRCCARRARTD